MIDSLARLYYRTHEQILEWENEFVNQIILLHKEEEVRNDKFRINYKNILKSKPPER